MRAGGSAAAQVGLQHAQRFIGEWKDQDRSRFALFDAERFGLPVDRGEGERYDLT